MKPFVIRWRNFRAFADTQDMEIRPLTILIGPNNSGKTSILAPLLLMKQTLLSNDEEPGLVTRGQFINAGSYRDLIHGHDVERELSFAISFRRQREETDLGPLGQYPPARYAFTFTAEPDPNLINLQGYEVFDPHGRQFLERHRSASGQYSLEFPYSAQGRKDSRKDQGGSPVDDAVRDAIKHAIPEHFLFTDFSAMAAAIEALGQQEQQEQDGHPKPNELTLQLSRFSTRYMRVVNQVSGDVNRLFDSIYYIGPLRERPQRIYEISGELPPEVGTRGEYAPEVLYRRRSDVMLATTNDWLRRFDFSGNIEVASPFDGIFALAVRRADGAVVNFADVGFGLSQVLPLIVQSIYAPSDSIIIAEQPEIHLNPKLQTTLADLFCDAVAQGKGIIVETHSEHLLLRLRVLIAQRVISAEDVALYYVEREGVECQVRRIPVESNGHIDADTWPAGFFEDSLREALSLALTQSQTESLTRVG